MQGDMFQLAEVGAAARAGKAPHADESPDLTKALETGKRLNGSGRVANCPDCERVKGHSVLRGRFPESIRSRNY